MTDQPKPPFWRSLLSGRDNSSFAIGRVLAFIAVLLVLLVLVIGLPALVASLYAVNKARTPEEWKDLFMTLVAYVPAILVALGTFATALVALTAQTEPRPPEPPTGGQ